MSVSTIDLSASDPRLMVVNPSRASGPTIAPDLGALPDDREMVALARTDRRAFASLYELHYDAVAGYIYRRTGRRDATEDLVSQTFLLAFTHLRRYRDRGLPFRCWLWRIATNEVNNWSRRQERAFRQLDEDHETEPDRADGDRDTIELDQMRRMMRNLSPKFQAVLALYYLEDLGVSEVATVLGCRAGTVKSRLARARDALRAQLEKEAPDAHQTR